jgi:hypothetical protein
MASSRCNGAMIVRDGALAIAAIARITLAALARLWSPRAPGAGSDSEERRALRTATLRQLTALALGGMAVLSGAPAQATEGGASGYLQGMDPREEKPLAGVAFQQNGWVGGPIIDVLMAHLKSLKEEPPIREGTPDP